MDASSPETLQLRSGLAASGTCRSSIPLATSPEARGGSSPRAPTVLTAMPAAPATMVGAPPLLTRIHPTRGAGPCPGRQGAVQLCEHVHVSWDYIEGHMSEWKTRRPGDWDQGSCKACMVDFRVECRDPSHDGVCTVENGPVWPQACLQNAVLVPPMVLSSLEWSHHSRLDALAYNQGHQVRASDVRELIKGCRESTGGILSLPTHPDLLPEMACYDSSRFRCLLSSLSSER